MTPLVSVIIPVFNRAHLIGETLQSVLNQIYTNWECIVVDDGSNDFTEKVVMNFVNKDERFQFYKRSRNKIKGGNACRNIGAEKAEGTYIQFFDSDDLMENKFLIKKVNSLLREQVDFVISKTIDFIHPDSDAINKINNYKYVTDKNDVSHFNYVTQKINWLTPDAMIKSSIAKKIKWNEHIKRGQEYNYFAKLTLFSTKAAILNEYLTRRRLHNNSIKSSYTKEEMLQQSISLRIETLKEICDGTSENVKKWFTANLAKNASLVKTISWKENLFIANKILRYYGFGYFVYYSLARTSKCLLGRNEKLRRPLKKMKF